VCRELDRTAFAVLMYQHDRAQFSGTQTMLRQIRHQHDGA